MLAFVLRPRRTNKTPRAKAQIPNARPRNAPRATVARSLLFPKSATRAVKRLATKRKNPTTRHATPILLVRRMAGTPVTQGTRLTGAESRAHAGRAMFGPPVGLRAYSATVARVQSQPLTGARIRASVMSSRTVTVQKCRARGSPTSSAAPTHPTGSTKTPTTQMSPRPSFCLRRRSGSAEIMALIRRHGAKSLPESNTASGLQTAPVPHCHRQNRAPLAATAVERQRPPRGKSGWVVP